MNDDDETLIAGANNLLDFAANNDEMLREGYAVDNLSQMALDSTGETFPASEDTYGVTLQYSVGYSIENPPCQYGCRRYGGLSSQLSVL